MFKSFWIGIWFTVPIQLNFYAFLKSGTKNKFEEIIKLIYKIELGREINQGSNNYVSFGSDTLMSKNEYF